MLLANVFSLSLNLTLIFQENPQISKDLDGGKGGGDENLERFMFSGSIFNNADLHIPNV